LQVNGSRRSQALDPVLNGDILRRKEMRFTTLSRLLAVFALVALLVPTLVTAQSTTTGAISGTVTDPSGAVLPEVTVTLKNTEKGFTETVKTNAQGAYQFSLLEPAVYAITVSAPNFKTMNASTTVSVGQNAIVNARLEVGAAGAIVEVSGEAPLLQSETSEISTTFNEREISEVPNPGNDLSFIAQTAAGSVMNTEGGYGNFSSFGVSASSNLFTLNGMYDNDPFLNLNNSGATNLLLGQNEVQEATVVTNGYSGQYGGFVGANVNYITKSGSNNWHGNANYWWNGRVMNGNNYFHTNFQNQADDTPRPFVNANQYAASFGGPIVKNKIFFFWNYEGLRVALPVSGQVLSPTPAFVTAMQDNVANEGLGPASTAWYQQLGNVYDNIPNLSRAIPGYPTAPSGDTSGCQGPVTNGVPSVNKTFVDPVTGTAFGYGYNPCTQFLQQTQGTFTHEYLTSGRFDFNLGNLGNFFVRLQEDIGTQASYTDLENPAFNATSYQPEYQGQVSWNRTLGVKAANNLVFSLQYYRAIFGPQNLNASLGVFPTTLIMGDGSLFETGNAFDSALGGDNGIWPQGRNVTGYQVVDDYSYNLTSKHTLKLGLYFHRNLVSDHDYGLFSSGLLIPLSLADLFAGAGTQVGAEFIRNYPTALEQNVKLYQLGWYVQDEWKPTSTLKLTLALRADHNSNPLCAADCFARLSSPFASLDHSLTTPYNQAVDSGLAQAMPSFTNVAWQPRFGFAYAPSFMKNTVFRGGFGVFMDTFPGQIADSLSQNIPVFNGFTGLYLGALAGGAPGTYQAFAQGQSAVASQGIAGNGYDTLSGANTALINGFSNGGTLGSISAADPLFVPPNFNNAGPIHAPITYEWNFEVQHAFGNNTSFSLNYVGNHGIHQTDQNNGVNGYCPTSSCPNGWLGLPATQPDPRFLEVTEIQTNANSNYNGLSASFQHRFQRGLQFQVNYSWSHALDEISNGGFNGFGPQSILAPAVPGNLRAFNYGNADYDTRQYVSANYVYELPKGPTAFLKGWQLSGTLFARTGLPYTVLNTAVTDVLSGYGFGGPAFAAYSGTTFPTCGGPGGSEDGGFTSCIPTSSFPDYANPSNQLNTGLVNQRRNQFYGPHYFDTDMTIMKYTRIPRWETAKLGIGAQFFNLFNHPNFANPNNNINGGDFGDVTATVNPPTSILGSFLGGDASTRLIQLTAKFTF
jgi:Carboxypeptidase regulatory-like domain